MPKEIGNGMWMVFEHECFEALKNSKDMVKLHGPGIARVQTVGDNLNVQFKGITYEINGTDFEKAVDECKTD